jgi:diketogulonate reductase-like aldo/keto reductase
MEKLVDDGLTKSIGVSNFSLKEIQEVLGAARIKPVCNQIELHPYLPQNRHCSTIMDWGIIPVAYCPIGGPSILKPNDLIHDPTVKKVAEAVGKPVTQVLLKWSMQRGVPALVKSGKPERVQENFTTHDWKLTDEQMVSFKDGPALLIRLERSFLPGLATVLL